VRERAEQARPIKPSCVPWGGLAAAIAVASAWDAPAGAQGRTDENAITQAEDAFGFSLGRETLGIYNAGNVRGFSPTSAGNVRIEGLYFDPAVFGLTDRLLRSSSIRIGLAEQGYPFISPTGVVDLRLRKPGDRAGASSLASLDSRGTAGVELDAALPLTGHLSLGLGGSSGETQFADGTDNVYHNEAVILRWRPAPSVEILSFWNGLSDYDDEAGPTYVMAGAALPPREHRGRFSGAPWADIRSDSASAGLLTSVAPARNWLVRAGLFRSVSDNRRSFTFLLLNEDRQGEAQRVIIADPRIVNRSYSGELRISHVISEGERLHTLHLSLWGRRRALQSGGSQIFDYGRADIQEPLNVPAPDFRFGALRHDRVTQWNAGLAYEGRWRGRGELGASVSRADYAKRIAAPAAPAVESSSRPWLYNLIAGANLNRNLVVYAGMARGLEESGQAPVSSANRGQALPAIITSQREAGLRITLQRLHLIAGLFELRKPYFNFNAANFYEVAGSVENRGLEFSLSGPITDRLSVAAGAYFLRPRLTGQSAAAAAGRLPVGLPSRLVQASLDWRLPWVRGLSLDGRLSNQGRVPATVDNDVFVPSRTIFSLGGRYRFNASGKDLTLRISVSNVGDVRGWTAVAPGTYYPIPGRSASAYLAVDL
jgi:iron complex outermembrane receptor protein